MKDMISIFRCNMGCAFDQILQGGSVGFVVWETAKAVKEMNSNIDVNIVIPMSGKLSELEDKFNVIRRDDCDFEYKVPLTLNKDIWAEDKFPDEVSIKTEVYQVVVDGVSVFLFSNDFSNSCSKTLYPFFDTRGKDISFYKQLLYQVDCYYFIKNYETERLKIAHIHDINNGYLLSALLNPIKNVKTVVSIIDSKMFEQAVYEPLLNDIMKSVGIESDIKKNPDASGLPELITYGGGAPEFSTGEYLFKNYLLPQHLVYRYADIVTADSPGHFEFISSYIGSSLEQFYKDEFEDSVSALVKANRFLPASLGIYKEWFEVYDELKDFTFDESEKFDGITFFHNARFDPFHKGQFELFAAIEQVLEQTKKVKFILSLVVFVPEVLNDLKELKNKYPENIELVSDVLIGKKNMSKKDLAMLMKRSDFTIAPSKNSLESFNFAIGEAMLFGNIPLISDQLPMKHWLEGFDDETREELSLPNVFGNEDVNEYLTNSIAEKILHIVSTYTVETMNELRKISNQTAMKYKLENTAEKYNEIYNKLLNSTASKVLA